MRQAGREKAASNTHRSATRQNLIRIHSLYLPDIRSVCALVSCPKFPMGGGTQTTTEPTGQEDRKTFSSRRLSLSLAPLRANPPLGEFLNKEPDGETGLGRGLESDHAPLLITSFSGLDYRNLLPPVQRQKIVVLDG